MEQGHHKKHSFKQMLVSILIHFVAMYVIMFTMIDSMNDFYNNLNQAYMTLTMVSAMTILMVVSMREMYTKKMLKFSLLALSGVLILSFIFTRQQTLIGDKQFLRSMIPHHSGAVLMCAEAPIVDAEIKQLCKNILESQKAEISQMKKILDRL